jgi:hypothetical protein
MVDVRFEKPYNLCTVAMRGRCVVGAVVIDGGSEFDMKGV